MTVLSEKERLWLHDKNYCNILADITLSSCKRIIGSKVKCCGDRHFGKLQYESMVRQNMYPKEKVPRLLLLEWES